MLIPIYHTGEWCFSHTQIGWFESDYQVPYLNMCISCTPYFQACFWKKNPKKHSKPYKKVGHLFTDVHNKLDKI